MPFTEKQREFLDNANHRWNFKTGATRSGKTYLDYYVIPKRIKRVRGKAGLIVILGNTKGTLQRNIIEPLQTMYGVELVSNIRSDNTAMLFGEKCYCLGADNVNRVNKIRGASIKYCYGDEVATWSKEIFDMLKSRLDKDYSKFDGTLNPEHPNHWLKQFLDSDADIYNQHYTIFDNPTLSKTFVDNLIKEYQGTVYYDRYILGKWKGAEGLIYKLFASEENAFIVDEPPPIIFATVGVDFGGNKSATSFTLIGYTQALKEIVVLKEYYKKKEITPKELEKAFIEFVQEAKKDYVVADAYCDSAETTLIKGLKQAVAENGVGINIHKARKSEINDRIKFTLRLMGQGRFKVCRECFHLREALNTAVWDDEKIEDVRLDDGFYNIDSLDSLEYSFEPHMNTMLNY